MSNVEKLHSDRSQVYFINCSNQTTSSLHVNIWECIKVTSQADAVLVDESGRLHPVHSLLLALKFPMFGGLGLEPRKLRHVILAEVSPEVVELLVDFVYGMDR